MGEVGEAEGAEEGVEGWHCVRWGGGRRCTRELEREVRELEVGWWGGRI